MKRLPLSMLALLATLSLVACTPKANTSTSSAAQSSQEARKTLELTVLTEAGLTSKTVAFKEGQSVMDLLKENFEVKEDNGLVTAIDGLEQQPAKKIYWMYEVNGSLADKGAADFYPEAGDTIKFYQEQF